MLCDPLKTIDKQWLILFNLEASTTASTTRQP